MIYQQGDSHEFLNLSQYYEEVGYKSIDELRIAYRNLGTDGRRAINRIARLMTRDGLQCHYCGKTMKFKVMGLISIRLGLDATIDHIVPKSKGGQLMMDNIVLACADCNTRRGNKQRCRCKFCCKAYDKYRANARLNRNSYSTLMYSTGA